MLTFPGELNKKEDQFCWASFFLLNQLFVEAFYVDVQLVFP